MSARRRRTEGDQRRRRYGQNLLADPHVGARLLARLAMTPGECVVEIGPGRGALTLPLARAGARVLAVERDPRMVHDLREVLFRERLHERVRVVHVDARRVRWPAEPFRVVANLPFGITTALLAHMLDDPSRGPRRADVLVQREVARKRAAEPPTSLRSAAWAPWWRFTVGETVPRTAFRPVPSVDAAWLRIDRRDPPILPEYLAPGMRAALRPVWNRQRGG